MRDLKRCGHGDMGFDGRIGVCGLPSTLWLLAKTGTGPIGLCRFHGRGYEDGILAKVLSLQEAEVAQVMNG